MSTLDYAKSELEKFDWEDDKEIYDGMLSRAVMKLIKCFDDQGHSGASAGVVLHVFERLVHFKPLTPLTGEDDEWADRGNGQYQNKRCSSVFKSDKDGAYQLDKSKKDGKTPIKFPFSPK